jgi:hypothetical protein
MEDGWGVEEGEWRMEDDSGEWRVGSDEEV